MKLIFLSLALNTGLVFDASTAVEERMRQRREIHGAFVPRHDATSARWRWDSPVVFHAGQRGGRNLRFGYMSGVTLIEKLKNSDTPKNGYGNSVSVSKALVAVGAKGEDKVYLYNPLDGAALTGSPYGYGGSSDQFGHAVATYGDVLIVGAPDAFENDENIDGKVYIGKPMS